MRAGCQLVESGSTVVFITGHSWAAVLGLVVLWLALWLLAAELLSRGVSSSLSYVVLGGSCAALCCSPLLREVGSGRFYFLSCLSVMSPFGGSGAGCFVFLWSVSWLLFGWVYCFFVFFQCSCFRPLLSLLLCFINVVLINYILL